ncbi:hypothetical protein BB560_000612 [Smittium megazygosporum]|uniref:Kynureninase n=1 Tax=Smittium megazygosporum TaxID=133381 RepID=A0A2T9ZJS1_9FUNG|nr:hypothetical protein BB560_000612 [Smittium megazygosporum]
MTVSSDIATFEDYLSRFGPSTSKDLALKLDAQKELASFRDDFEIPTVESVGGTKSITGDIKDKGVYMCSNSLGLMPKSVRKYIEEDLDVWSKEGVFSHGSNRHGNPWVSTEDRIVPMLEKVVGGLPGEVTVMNTLTVNLHLLFASFYLPTPDRFKILIEKGSFPSDFYAVHSHMKMKGYDPAQGVIEIAPREGEDLIRHEDIVKLIEDHGHEIALIWLPGVQYYTGQVFRMEEITKLGHEKGCVVGFDFAHAAGNIPLKLHDWDIDFAVWCHYKYMCSCGGAPGGAFVHNRFARDFERNRLTGWWAHKLSTRFVMDNKLDLCEGIDGFRVSNQPTLALSGVRASIEVFNKTSMEALRARSLVLTGYLEYLLKNMDVTSKKVKIITSENTDERGSQLSICFPGNNLDDIFNHMKEYGVVTDLRRPRVMRVAPAALYSTFEDVWNFVEILNKFEFK